MSAQEVIKIEDDFTLIRFQNDSDQPYCAIHDIGSGLIQFHFGLKGSGKLMFNSGSYSLEMKEEKS